MRKILIASATQCSTGALLRILRHGGLQPRIKEDASHHARRGKNAEVFLINTGKELETYVEMPKVRTLLQEGAAKPLLRKSTGNS